MRGSVTPSHPEDTFHLPKGANFSINTCKRTVMISCKSPSATACLRDSIYSALEGKVEGSSVVPRGG